MSKGTIIVIGAGVLGLSTALCIQEQTGRSHSIVLVAREFPGDTSINYASPWAGAHYRPVPGTSPQAVREASQARRTYEFLRRLAAADPSSGVQSVRGIEHLEAPPPEYRDSDAVRQTYAHLSGFRVLPEEELPEGVRWGAQYETFVVNPPVYCAYMLRLFILRGGCTKRYTLASLMEACSLSENVTAVVNCSGMGFGDSKSFVIRGQTCLVRNPCSVTLTRQNADGTWSFCIPRPLGGGTIIGGTKQPHDWDPQPSAQTREQLLARAAKWFPFPADNSRRQFDVICDIVGRRPARQDGVRIEIEKVSAPVLRGGAVAVVHAYGAGGRGYELSRGIAEDAVQLMAEQGLLLLSRDRPSL